MLSSHKKIPNLNSQLLNGYIVNFALVGVLLVMNGCSSSFNPPPVTDLSRPFNDAITTHLVSKGDTLYSIAWRYEISVDDLMKFNGLNSANNILPGQLLYVSTSLSIKPSNSKVVTSAPPRQVSSQVVTKKITTTKKVNQQQGKPTKSIVDHQGDIKLPTGCSIKSSYGFIWPTCASHYVSANPNSALSQGIDIHLKIGESIVAANDGKVVYAGDALKGYGNLIILEHAKGFLTAYGYNQRLLVIEGTSVKRGTKIAISGRDASGTPLLHFEVRHFGKPVDALKYLPLKEGL